MKLRDSTRRLSAVILLGAFATASAMGAGAASAAPVSGAGATAATRISQLATDMQRIPVAMAGAVATRGEARAMGEARAAMFALRTQIKAALPADATPEALAAQAVLVELSEEYARQFADGMARGGMSLTGQARDLCRLDHHTRGRLALDRGLRRFDVIAEQLAAQSGVRIAHLSGVGMTARAVIDFNRVGAAGLCILVTVNNDARALNTAAKATDRRTYAALATATSERMSRALAFLSTHKPPQTSPYLAMWRATVAYASAQRTLQRALADNATVGAPNRAKLQSAQAPVPRLAMAFIRAMQTAGMLPSAPASSSQS